MTTVLSDNYVCVYVPTRTSDQCHTSSAFQLALESLDPFLCAAMGGNVQPPGWVHTHTSWITSLVQVFQMVDSHLKNFSFLQLCGAL